MKEKEADAPARVVAQPALCGRCRKGANQQEDQDDEQIVPTLMDASRWW